MGNVPAKERRSRSTSLALDDTVCGLAGINAPAGLRGSRQPTSSSSSSSSLELKRWKRQQEKDLQLQRHIRNLVVRYDETVDGGYLAPYGTYKCNLDYDTIQVRQYIQNRELAPFYTPLQDFDPTWLDAELLAIRKQQSLHALEDAYDMGELLDDPDDHKIGKLAAFFRRQEQKERRKFLQAKAIEEQRVEEARYQDANNSGHHPMLASGGLLLDLYRNATECPICFLYYPPWLNISRCCGQPICTECFVQIKRADPHPPHDETTPNSHSTPEEAAAVLVSEPAQCPYCALTEFGVIYAASDINTGMKACTKPLEYKSRHCDKDLLPGSSHTRHITVPANAGNVITVDHVRPNWKQTLASARNKRARKAAAASAIHASNMLIGNSSLDDHVVNPDRLQILEMQMIERAMQLSLADQEQRQ